MSRYIDAVALKYYGNHIGDEYEDRFHDAQWVYRSQIDDAPSIDIVRCRECKYAHMTYGGECKYCDKWSLEDSLYLDGDFFCSYGERREP